MNTISCSGALARPHVSFLPHTHRQPVRMVTQAISAPSYTSTETSVPGAESLSLHPDAIRRREMALRRKGMNLAQAELATRATWWEGVTPSNLCMTSSPQQLTDQIASSTQLLVVDFFSSWCSACRRLYPKLKQIAENNPDVIFVKVNAGAEGLQDMAIKMGIQQLPYFQFYKGGKLINQFASNLTRVNHLRAEIAANKDCNDGGPCEA